MTCSLVVLKILVLWRKIVENLLIFLYLFCPKNGGIDFTKPFITQEWLVVENCTTPRCIFNALLIGVQYTLSFQWTNFGLKCLPLTRLGDVPLRRHWVFHLRLVWEVEEALLHPLETSPRCTNKISWRRNTETSWWRSTKTSLLWVSFETYLRRHWNVQRDVVTTSLPRLVAWWVNAGM